MTDQQTPKAAEPRKALNDPAVTIPPELSNGRTALMMAVADGDRMRVQFLVEGGAGVNLRPTGRPLRKAASR